MANNKKTKIHKKIEGQLLQMNKTFNNLKMKQKDKITGWVYEEYKKYVTEHDKAPDLLADEQNADICRCGCGCVSGSGHYRGNSREI